MKKEFIKYEQTLALKELGFNEPCLAFYDLGNSEQIFYNNAKNGTGDYKFFINNERLKWFGTPLYQQAFRWFREKYNITVYMYLYFKNEYQELKYLKPNGYRYITFPYGKSKVYETYEETELECLKKLIEIVKSL